MLMIMKNRWYDHPSWFFREKKKRSSPPLFYYFFGPRSTVLGMAGPVIWTINLSHIPLCSGRLWNNTTMLLKSDRAAGEEKKNSGRVWRLCFSCPVVVRLHVWMMRVCVCVCVCVFSPGKRVHSWSALSAWVLCILCYRLSRILFPHLDFAQRRYNVKWGISAASKSWLFW